MLIILGKAINFTLGAWAALTLLASETQDMDNRVLRKRGLSCITAWYPWACGLNIFVLCQNVYHIVLILQQWGCCICIHVPCVVVGKHVASYESGERNVTWKKCLSVLWSRTHLAILLPSIIPLTPSWPLQSEQLSHGPWPCFSISCLLLVDLFSGEHREETTCARAWDKRKAQLFPPLLCLTSEPLNAEDSMISALSATQLNWLLSLCLTVTM